MGYRIDYGQPSDKKYPMPDRRSRLPGLLLAALALFLLLTSQYWPQGREALRDMLIPGDSAVTSAAFSTMLEDVRAGSKVSDAMACFCREILQNGKTAD